MIFSGRESKINAGKCLKASSITHCTQNLQLLKPLQPAAVLSCSKQTKYQLF